MCRLSVYESDGSVFVSMFAKEESESTAPRAHRTRVRSVGCQRDDDDDDDA